MSETGKFVSLVNQAEMAGFIKANGTGCRFVSLVTRTPVKLNKKSRLTGQPCPFGAVEKVSRKQGLLNVNFVASVERKVAEFLGVKPSEVEYEASEVWYEHLMTPDGKALPLVQHKDETKRDGKLYLQYFPRTSENSYVGPTGETLTKEQLAEYMAPEREQNEFKPIVIAVGLGNVKEIRASGLILTLPDLQAAEAALVTAK